MHTTAQRFHQTNDVNEKENSIRQAETATDGKKPHKAHFRLVAVLFFRHHHRLFVY